jgi:subtilisin
MSNKHKFTTLPLVFFVAVFAVLSVGFRVHANEEPGRYFIDSNNLILKGLVGVQHDFDRGFTADFTPGQLKAFEQLARIFGAEVEAVPQYEITQRRDVVKPPASTQSSRAPVETPSAKPESKPINPGKGGGDKEPTPVERVASPSNQTPWGIKMIYDNPSISKTSGGNGVIIAVLDTGVNVSHIDLSRRVIECKDFTRRAVKNGCEDGNGHGTHVAGTVLADGGEDGKGIYGVAPDASLFAYKVCGNSGSCWADDIAQAIRHASDQGAHIISMSLGSNSESSLIRDAINYAYGKTLIVAAAGNDGPAEGSIDYPGANAKVVAVGALNSSMLVTNFSSRGINNNDGLITEREVEFAAPGLNIESTWNDGTYKSISGTSMATPHVSGLAAKLWKGSALETRAYLKTVATDISPWGEDIHSGFGIPLVKY